MLAAFDRDANHVLGMAPPRFEERDGLREFCSPLTREPNLYANPSLMPDAKRLLEAVLQSIGAPMLGTGASASGCPREE